MEFEVTRVEIEVAGHRVSLGFRKPALEPTAADDFERWMLGELKSAITERIEACVAEGEPWPGGVVTVPIVLLPSGERVWGTARVVDGEPTEH